MANSQDEELISFLTDTSGRHGVRLCALDYVLGLTANEDGVKHILEHRKYLSALCSIASEENRIGQNACKCLVNISSYESGACAFIDMSEISFFQWLVDGLTHDAQFVELRCHIISNISRYAEPCEKLASWFLSDVPAFQKMVDLFCSQDQKERVKYYGLATLFGNLTQLPTGQRLFLNKDHPFILKLLPYTSCMESATRRIGIARTLRNCCFSIDHHMWLLQKTDIIPALLLPLAGPEEFDDEENEKLPVDLQYLELDKVREPNPTIRKLLIESIIKLCATKPGRTHVKGCGTYLIMRELHKWETDESVLETCLNLVDILIGDEPEEGMDNLMEVKIPENIEQLFKEENSSSEGHTETVVTIS